MKLEITKEKVLEAASKCDTAKATLKVLFPEVFKQKDAKVPEFTIKCINSQCRLVQKSIDRYNKIWVNTNDFIVEYNNAPGGGMELVFTPRNKQP